MAEKYDEDSDFKRNSNQNHEQDGEEGVKLNEKAGEYMRELLSEKIKLSNGKFPMSSKLVDQEVARLQASGRIPPRDSKYVDVFHERPVKVTVKVLVPLKEHPKFNFVGKLLGPKGNTMKQLQEETMCKMAVLGRGSMRDKQKEEELRTSLDPKYAHLTDELHVEISAMAPPAEAHARIAYALAEVKKYLIPDPGEMMGPMMDRDTGMKRRTLLANPEPNYMASVTRHTISYQEPLNVGTGGRPLGPPGRMPPRMPPAQHPPPPMARPMPGKSKVISILDRARSAMESSYSYDDPYAQEPVRGPPRAPEADFYYEQRTQDRYYEDDNYFKEEPSHDYKASARDVGTRRPGPTARTYTQARPQPYGARPKYTPGGGGGMKKRMQ